MTAVMTVVLLFFIVLLFPDGHPPSPRWRPVLWGLVVLTPVAGIPPAWCC